jgi:hypothetical protein
MRYASVAMLVMIPAAMIGQGLFESASAEEQKQSKRINLDISGYGRGSGYLGFENYDISSVFGEFAFQGKVNMNSAFMFADIRFRGGVRFDEPSHEFQLKEMYAGFSGDRFDALLGNQIVNWGRADGFNPINCITPSDYFFLSGAPDDQKLSNFMLRLKVRFSSQIELVLIGIPVYRPSIYQYELFDMGETVSFADMILPEQSFGNSSLAARLNFEYPEAGFSLAWFRGYNPDYSIDVQNIDFSTGIPEITNVARPYFKNMIGGDITLPLRSWIFRGEFAHNITSDYKEHMYIPNPDLHYVVGLEHSFRGLNTILQYIGRYTFDFTELEEPVSADPDDPLAQAEYAEDLIIYKAELFARKSFYQQKETNHALALTVSKAFAYDTWNMELTGLYNVTSDEYMLRPKISWNISDALTASAGCTYMTGPDEELFSYAGPVLNGAFLELKVNF